MVDALMIPYGHQSISDDDIHAVVNVLKSDFLTQGPMVPRFEKIVCDYTGAKYAVAVNSGTSALHIACKSLDLGIGDWLWTTPISFVASANCALYCGAKVDFVDIDPLTTNISTEQLKEKLVKARTENRVPKVVVVVHFGGLSCDMNEIHALSQEYKFHVIEDACHAIGGKYKDKPIGSCQYSDITVFSFHPVKAITTGEGGMAVTNNSQLSDKMEILRSHGITKNPEKFTKKPDGPWFYQQIDLGFNYRMSDLQAALGISQMKRLDFFLERRHYISEKYHKLLKNLPLKLPFRPEDRYSGMHLYVIRLKLEQINQTQLQIFESLQEAGIGVNIHYIPIHTQPYYQTMGFRLGDFNEAEAYYKEAISIPMFPDMTDENIETVVASLRKCLL